LQNLKAGNKLMKFQGASDIAITGIVSETAFNLPTCFSHKFKREKPSISLSRCVCDLNWFLHKACRRKAQEA